MNYLKVQLGLGKPSNLATSKVTYDHLFVLNPIGKRKVRVNGIDIFPLEFDFLKFVNIRDRIYQFFNLFHFRNLLLYNIRKYYFEELFDEVRSFDPDVIDLRSIPQSSKLKNQLLSKFPHWEILTPVDRSPNFPIDSSWRHYDPSLKVSIVLPVYNGEDYLVESIKSCLQQTHQNLELIIVDDGSDDHTPEIINEFARKDVRVISIRNKQNLKLPSSLNIGFARARGDLLTWTSHDNYYTKDAIKTLAQYLCTWTDIDFVYSAYFIINVINGEDIISPNVNYLPPPWQLRFRNTVGAYFLYRREIYERVGLYRASMEYMEDYEYWIRVYKKGFKMMRLHIPKYYYRRHAKSMTAQVRNRGTEFWEKVEVEPF